MKLSNKAICPEDLLGIQLPADKIPDGAKVRRVAGERELTLKQDLLLYQEQSSQHMPPVKVEGYFLVSDAGEINQIAGNTLLCWLVRADDFIDMVQLSWEGVPSDA